jgi:hypothetical protein
LNISSEFSMPALKIFSSDIKTILTTQKWSNEWSKMLKPHFLVVCQLLFICGGERFRAPKFASWKELEVIRGEFGKCWVGAHICTLHSEYEGLCDEFDEAYQTLEVGIREDKCLSRAFYHWRLCGNNMLQPVTMTFRPSGATSSYPPDDIVEAQVSSNFTNVTAIVYSAVFGGYDLISHPVDQTVPTEFWMFTDSVLGNRQMNQTHASGQIRSWIVVEAAPRHHTPRLAAKWFKVFPEQVL